MFKTSRSEIKIKVNQALISLERNMKDIRVYSDNMGENVIEVIIEREGKMVTSYVINIPLVGDRIGIVYAYSGIVTLNSVNNLSGFLIQDIRRRIYETYKD